MTSHLIPREELDVSPTDVVVLLLWHLGDVLNSTALLPALVERHNRKITFVTTRSCAPILENNPFVARVVVARVDPPNKLTTEIWRALQEFPRKHLSRAGTVYNLHMNINLDHAPRHIVGSWAMSLGLDIADEDLRPEFYPTQRAKQPPERERLVVVGAGGYSAEKRWPGDRWTALMSLLRQDHPDVRIVQLGTSTDPLIEGAEDARGMTIEESFHVLSRAAICVTHDSFLAHLAPVAGCRTVVIYGPTSPRHFRPLSRDAFVAGGYRIPPRPRSLMHLSAWLLPQLCFPSVRRVRGYVKRYLSEPLPG